MTGQKRYFAGDIGSNAIKARAVEIEGVMRRTLVDTRYPIRLGTAAFNDGRLDQKQIGAAAAAFQEIGAAMRGLGPCVSRIVATSAVREAVNSAELIKAVAAQADVRIEIICGADEARLLALGARPDMTPNVRNMLIDIGGGSTELIYTRADLSLDSAHSLRLGAVRLHQMVSPGNPVTPDQFMRLEREIANVLHEARLTPAPHPANAIGAAGTMCAILGARRARDMSLIRPCSSVFVRACPCSPRNTITFRELDDMICALREMTIGQMREQMGIDSERASIIVPGALIARGLMKLHSLESIQVTAHDLRDGLIAAMIAADATL
ncbi:MAG: hypothetical protein WCK47_13050 [bacterium]|nr:hypothetical protein [Candidatus Sumerlaeota bacterium]